jgi:NADPH:quinone reductase-like Zn-dependent oxidoreductase
MLGPDLAAVVALAEQGELTVRVDSVHPFADAAAAHRRLESGTAAGKVVLIPPH